MAIWAIADLHLCFGVPDKSMERFGLPWDQYTRKIEENWRRLIGKDDLVLIAGDISWAMRLTEAVKDLEWIDKLPGTKVMIRGNHDYWWSSAAKVRAHLPSSLHIIQNDAFHWKDVSVAGTRLWDLPGCSFSELIDVQGEMPIPDKQEEERIFLREVERLTLSLARLHSDASIKIAMTHYPPISADLQDSVISKLFEQYQIQFALFGHLHQVKKGRALFGIHNKVHYLLTAADYLDFCPLLVHE